MTFANALEALRDTVDIVELLDYYGVQNNGRDVICPFHNDHKYGNCKIYQNKCHCYACNTTFDAFALIMQMENVSFAEATKTLAGIYNITIDEYSAKENVPRLPRTSRNENIFLEIPDGVVSWSEIYKNNNKLYNQIVLYYCDEKIRKLSEIKESYSRRTADFAYIVSSMLPPEVDKKDFFQKMESLCVEEIDKAKNIRARFE